MAEGRMDDDADNFTHAFCREISRQRKAGEAEDGFQYVLTSRILYAICSQWQLYIALMDLWSAGMETTATTMEWALLYMATHPDVQQKVAHEIDTAIGDRRVTVADRLRMPYTAATITEVQRCANIIPIWLQHATQSDVTIGGYLIPKGNNEDWKLTRCCRNNRATAAVGRALE